MRIASVREDTGASATTWEAVAMAGHEDACWNPGKPLAQPDCHVGALRASLPREELCSFHQQGWGG